VTTSEQIKYTPASDISKINKSVHDPWPEPDSEPAKLMDPAKKTTLDLFGKPEPFAGFEAMRPIDLPEFRQLEARQPEYQQQLQQLAQPVSVHYAQQPGYHDEWVQ